MSVKLISILEFFMLKQISGCWNVLGWNNREDVSEEFVVPLRLMAAEFS